MIKYVLRKAAGWVVMIVVATNLTYLLASAYLDPRANYLERRPPLPKESIDQMLTPLNLNYDVPLLERWWVWIRGIVLHWDWGQSPMQQSVNEQIGFRIWVSAQLVLGGTIIAAVLGIAIGVYTASRQYKLADRVFQGISIVAMNIHVVVASQFVVLLGIEINKLFGYNPANPTTTPIFYVAGSASSGVEGFWPVFIDKLQHLALPTVCLVIVGYSGYHFMQRSLLLDNIAADYVRTARAKGLTKPLAIRRHALRTSVIPVATQLAFSIPAVFTGAVMTETIFAWKGMGSYFIETISKNDVHGVVAVAAFGALMTAIGAILADTAIVFLDPRVRVS